MVYKRLGMAALLGFCVVFPLSAYTISFLVIETGIQAEAGGTGYPPVWEDGFMGVFFDSGHIVSNSPAARLPKSPETGFPGEAEKDFREAVDGGAEYFILIFLEFAPREKPLRPHAALIRVFAIGRGGEISRNLIYEGRFSVGKGAGFQDEYIKAQETAGIVADQLKDR